MKLTIDRARLAEALGAVTGTIERRTTIPILSYVLLKADGSDLAIAGTDLQFHVRTTVEAEVTAPGAVAVPAHVLADAAARLGSETVSLTLDGKRDRLTVAGGRSRVQLSVLPAEDFPGVPTVEAAVTGDIESADLLALIDATAHAISTDETRYYLCGILLHAAKAGKEPVLAAVATDGHRLARRAVGMNGLAGRWPQHGNGIGGVIVPKKAVHLISKMAKGWTSLRLAISPTVIEVTAGPTVLTAKLIDGSYPDYERVIPRRDGSNTIIADRVEMAEAVRRVAVAAEDRARAVALDLAPSGLKLSVGNQGNGAAADDEIDATLEGKPVRVGAAARYLAEMLEAHTLDTVTLHVIDPGSPIVIPGEGPLDVQVIMPMRVDEA